MQPKQWLQVQELPFLTDDRQVIHCVLLHFSFEIHLDWKRKKKKDLIRNLGTANVVTIGAVVGRCCNWWNNYQIV